MRKVGLLQADEQFFFAPLSTGGAAAERQRSSDFVSSDGTAGKSGRRAISQSRDRARGGGLGTHLHKPGAGVTSSGSIMENFSVRRLAVVVGCCLLALNSGCKRTKESAKASPTPSAKASQAAEVEPVAPPLKGPLTPAIVDQKSPDSVAAYLHFPKDPGASKMNGAVQFYCDVTEDGIVESTHALVGNDDSFKDAVQTALDWGRFKPATVDGQPTRVYLGGTVLFLHQNGEEVIVVSLATADRERVGKLTNYIQPQLVGGLRHAMEKEIAKLTKGILVAGRAEEVVQVDQDGKVTATSDITENPKGSGLGGLLDRAVRHSNFTPAYQDGKPGAGAINVVADFTKF